MLERFGFTPTESKSYQALLRLGPSTGYGVARETGIARANIYQALESLVRRGAARKAATIPSQYTAAAPTALLAELGRSFQRDLASLEESLRTLPAVPAARGGPEPIERADGLLARAAAMADAASVEVLAVLGPWAPELAASLERAQVRGAQARAVSLGAPAPQGAILRPVPEGELRSYWGGLPVAVVADKAHAIMGIITPSGAASGLATDAAGVVPFVRHLLRREIAGGA